MRQHDDESYDIIIIGAGLGGSALASQLLQAKKKVLLIEKGASHLQENSSPLKGKHAELYTMAGMDLNEALCRAGRWSEPVIDNASKKDLCPMLGSGTGGSSALYGAVLERFWAIDFTPKQKIQFDGHCVGRLCDNDCKMDGASAYPKSVLKSKDSFWPNGIGNQHDLVGRNLMRHLVDFYYLDLPVECGENRALSDFAISDFYTDSAGSPLGSVKSSMGMMPYELVEFEVQRMIAGLAPFLLPMYKFFGAKLLEKILRYKIENGYIWAPIIEDLPYADNRVFQNKKGAISISYSLHSYEKLQIRKSRKKLKALFKDFKPFLLKQAGNNKFLAHSCGTCRFGNDPKTSVLDRYNKVHGTENLYVVDASFMPSSTGCNPSLTIAANALRVGEHIVNEVL